MQSQAATEIGQLNRMGVATENLIATGQTILVDVVQPLAEKLQPKDR